MARSKVSARDALMKLKCQQEKLAAEESRLREGAAADLGRVLLDCSAETLDPVQFRQLIRSVTTLGMEESLKRLDAR